MKIIIGADIIPTKNNYELFQDANIDMLIGMDLYELLRQADFIIMNLEGPLTSKRTPISKSGPCLLAPTKTIEGLKAINPFFYTLANNHILDQGKQGMRSTIELLERHGIAYAGVGKNSKDAAKPFVVDLKGIKMGIYCCAEHEFSVASATESGANPYDPLVSFDHVESLKKECDILIVLYHGGKEYYRYPSPEQQRRFRKFADVGADYVIAQQSHCVGCMETYKNSVLVYGQGNFLLDYVNDEYSQTSVLVCIEIGADKHVRKTSFIPCHKEGTGVRIATKNEAEQILHGFQIRSDEILNVDFINQRYRALANEMRRTYYSIFLGKIGGNFLIKVLSKVMGQAFWKMLFAEKYHNLLLNFMECETHRELLLEVIKSNNEKG